MTFLPAFRLAAWTASPQPTLAVAGLLAALLTVTGPSFGQATAADPLVAVVNGTDIHESDVRLADEDFGRSLPTQDQAIRREQIIAFLTDTIILAKVALDQNVGDEADLRRRVAFIRNKTLMGNLLEATGRQAVTEDAVRKAYEEVVLKVATEPELHLRALFFKFPSPSDKDAMQAAEDQARAAFKRISEGEDFAAVAAATSDDPTVKANGGEFGYRTRAEMGKEYAEIAFALEKGGVSQPIRTQFGWHIIKVEDKRERKPPDLESVRDKLASFVARKAQFDLIAKLRSEAKIERQDVPSSRAEKPEEDGK